MNATPKGNRLHIGIFGRMNVGKSSLLNFILGQDYAISSSIAGTTTDVVEKAVELLPIGPVVLLDTAGLDDRSSLSQKRLKKTRNIYDRSDIILLVIEPDRWTEHEEAVLNTSRKQEIPLIVIVNKTDLQPPSPEFLKTIAGKGIAVLSLSCKTQSDRDKHLGHLKQLLAECTPKGTVWTPSLIGDLLPAGGLAVMVVPIDLQAPQGRLILPQVQTIRDTLDNDGAALIVKERELSAMLSSLNRQPDIVVCDSQSILKVSADVPKDIPLTTFSVLFARWKGDLTAAAKGAAHIDRLRPGEKILISEACSHHAQQDDIGRVKIPRWLKQFTGIDVGIDVYSGRDYPDDLRDYRLIIHCGACMLTRREMLNRIERANEAGVSITNYGVAISFLQGVLQRTLKPFPSALAAYNRESAT